ncbi:hypothetical protein F5146DRAFT_323238 [Armillaria mellea]|nr:hypothetical protein F5146DRAFT_323238 [Armillaria mellea]
MHMWTLSSSHLALTRTFSLNMHVKLGVPAACTCSEVQFVLQGDTSRLSPTITIVGLTRRYPPPKYLVGTTVFLRMMDGVIRDEQDLLTGVVGQKAKVAGDACSEGAVTNCENVTVHRGRVTSRNLVIRWSDRTLRRTGTWKGGASPRGRRFASARPLYSTAIWLVLIVRYSIDEVRIPT